MNTLLAEAARIVERLRKTASDRVWPAPQDFDALALSSAACLSALCALVEEQRQEVGNLLALIHRDGGHYLHEHGLKKALADAEKLVLQERVAAEEQRARIAELEVLSGKMAVWIGYHVDESHVDWGCRRCVGDKVLKPEENFVCVKHVAQDVRAAMKETNT